jgi:hypothetical protein
MIRYTYAGRHNPQYQPDGQGVFRWQSVGTTATPSTATHTRLYHNWLLIGGPYNSVFVWQNAGGSDVPAATATPRVWNLRGGFGRQSLKGKGYSR